MSSEGALVGLDPLAFSLRTLDLRGALVERTASGALALLPENLAVDLGLPQEVELATDATNGKIPCGFGSSLLEKLIASLRSDVAFASVRVDAGAPRPQQARALAEKLGVRNAVADLLDVSAGEGSYVAAWIGFQAEADDRLDGLAMAVAGEDGSEPDDAVSALIDPTNSVSRLDETPGPGWLPRAACAFLAVRSAGAIRRASREFVESVARRHLRDHARIREYFFELTREARSPKRKIDPKVIDAKVRHMEEERDSKLRELEERYGTSISTRVVAILVAHIAEAVARVRIRRRKESRELRLRLPAGARGLSRIACDACLGSTLRPAFCDDALHVLCEACLPNAQGRPSCPRCPRS